MRVAAYLRVSTDRQAEEGLGLEVQEQAIRSWAKERGHRVVAWCRDEGVSGGNGLEGRVGLLDVFDAVKARRVSGLVVYRLDRLARDLMVQEALLADLWRLGVEVFSTSVGEASNLQRDDPDDPSRKFIRRVLGALSEYEREMIVARLRAGRRRKAERGGYAYGSPRYGERAENKDRVIDADEARMVEQVRTWRGEGHSYREICALLHADGFRPRRAASWQPAVVRKIALRG